MSTTSNAARMAQAVAAVATEVARTDIDVAHIGVDTYSASANGGGRGLTVKVQARTAEHVETLAGLFAGLPAEPFLYSDCAKHSGPWTGMGITVCVYGPAREQVSS